MVKICFPTRMMIEKINRKALDREVFAKRLWNSCESVVKRLWDNSETETEIVAKQLFVLQIQHLEAMLQRLHYCFIKLVTTITKNNCFTTVLKLFTQPFHNCIITVSHSFFNDFALLPPPLVLALQFAQSAENGVSFLIIKIPFYVSMCTLFLLNVLLFFFYYFFFPSMFFITLRHFRKNNSSIYIKHFLFLIPFFLKLQRTRNMYQPHTRCFNEFYR